MDQMLDAVDEALANLQPATVGIGYSESYISVNRNSVYNRAAEDGTVSQERSLGWSPDGATDRTVAALQFNAEDGTPIAFLINYAVHGTVMHANTCIDGKTGISSDIPGFVSTYLEQNNEGAVAMWLFSSTGLAIKDGALLKDTLVVNHVWQRDEQPNGCCADDWTIGNGGFGQRQARYQAGYLPRSVFLTFKARKPPKSSE